MTQHQILAEFKSSYDELYRVLHVWMSNHDISGDEGHVIRDIFDRIDAMGQVICTVKGHYFIHVELSVGEENRKILESYTKHVKLFSQLVQRYVAEI